MLKCPVQVYTADDDKRMRGLQMDHASDSGALFGLESCCLGAGLGCWGFGVNEKPGPEIDDPMMLPIGGMGGLCCPTGR